MKRMTVKLARALINRIFRKLYRCFPRFLLLCLVLTVVGAGVSIPSSVRKILLPVHKAWYPLSTLQLMKVLLISKLYAQSSDLVYLSPCLDLPKFFHLAGTGSDQQYNNTGPVRIEQNSHRSSASSEADVELYARVHKWVNSSAERNRTFSPFLPQMTLSDKARLLSTWRVFQEACRQHRIAYYLIEGSLLGAFRHNGIIPWDDDIDVGVDVKDLDRLKRALSCVPGYTLRVGSNMLWKFFAQNASIVVPVGPAPTILHSETFSRAREAAEYVPSPAPTEDVVMRFPFVDIFITKDFGGYVGALADFLLPVFYHPSENIYPLTVELFEDYLVPVPRKSLALLKSAFDPSMCVSPSFNHKRRLRRKVSQVSCKTLVRMYVMHHL